jgi:hypothetical protein
MATSNACIRLVYEAGKVSEPQYVFLISQTALGKKPCWNGMVHLLLGNTFINQPSLQFEPDEVPLP